MKKVLYFAMLVVASLTVMSWVGLRFGATDHDEGTDWAIKARSTYTEVPFSRMKDLAYSSIEGDHLAIFHDMVIYSGHENGDEPGYRALLNSHTDNQIWTDDQIQAEISYKSMPRSISWDSVFSSLLYLVLIVFLLIMIKRISSGPGGKDSSAYSLVKARNLKQGLDDVAGLGVARAQFREIISMIRSRGQIGDIGAKPPKGILLKGPPGTGKTLLARAMAKESGVNFMVLNASRLNDTFIGVGPRRVEAAFDLAAKNAPCIIFIDEIDAIGARDNTNSGASAERANLINTFLTCMDGLIQGKDVFIVAATNRPDMVDPAILRPGRIDRQMTIGLPNKSDREEILRLHSGKLPLDKDVDLSRLAASTPGMSGADLAGLCNEAGINAGRDGARTVSMKHFKDARRKLMMGETGSHTILTSQEREVCAWHEAGHAVAATLLENADPVEHATILPNGGSLGHVLQVPDDDRNMMTKAHLVDRLTILAAGRAAEIIRFGKDGITNGAAGDIDAMSKLATAMVTQWGMGRNGMHKTMPDTDGSYPKHITDEIMSICNQALERATGLLQENHLTLSEVAHGLHEKDTLSGREIRDIIDALSHGNFRGAA